MGHEHRGHPQVALEAGDLGPHLHPQLGVEVGQGLVHQEGGGLPHDGPAHGHPLALAARELARLAAQVLLQLQDAGCLADAPVPLGLGHPGQLQGEADVVVHAHVGVQGVVLEHHGDVAVLGGHLVDHPVVDADLAAGDLLQASHHPQSGGLAAARRPHQHQQLAVGDLQVEAADGREPVRVHLVDAVEDDFGHGLFTLLR